MSARSASVMGRGCAVEGFRLAPSEGLWKCFAVVVAMMRAYSNVSRELGYDC